MIQLTDKVWAVEVPDKVNDFKSFVKSVKNDEADTDVGKFQFLFTTKTATEEDARKVVGSQELFINGKSQGILYCNYHCQHDACEWYKYAAQSLHSLLYSKGLDPNKNNYTLIEKQSSDE